MESLNFRTPNMEPEPFQMQEFHIQTAENTEIVRKKRRNEAEIKQNQGLFQGGPAPPWRF